MSAPDPQVPGEAGQKQAENLKNLYQEIKEGEESIHSQKVQKLKQVNE